MLYHKGMEKLSIISTVNKKTPVEITLRTKVEYTTTSVCILLSLTCYMEWFLVIC
jgi:hypothetical protein